MSTLLLDTNTVSYQLRGHTLAEAYRPILDGNTLAISFMTVAEMFEGARRANWGARRVATLESILRKYLLLEFDMSFCWKWAEIRVSRRAQPIATDDAWIAAAALAHDIPLVTHNAADFIDIPGLRVISLSSPVA